MSYIVYPDTSNCDELVLTNSTNSSSKGARVPSPLASPSTTSGVAVSSFGGSVSTSLRISGLSISSSAIVRANLLGDAIVALSPPETDEISIINDSLPSCKSSLTVVIKTCFVSELPASNDSV